LAATIFLTPKWGDYMSFYRNLGAIALLVFSVSTVALANPPRYTEPPANSGNDDREREGRAAEREERNNNSGGGGYSGGGSSSGGGSWGSHDDDNWGHGGYSGGSSSRDDDYYSGGGSSSGGSSGRSCGWFRRCKEDVKPPVQVVDDTTACAQNIGSACAVYTFWWAKPHKEIKHKVKVEDSEAKFLKIMSVNTQGRQGKNGVVGFAKIKLYVSDGTTIDMLNIARAQYGQRISKSGKLFLKTEGEMMDIALPTLGAGAYVKAISIRADSWIDASTNAQIQVWLDSKPSEFIQLVQP
jgi:hypothetical protein